MDAKSIAILTFVASFGFFIFGYCQGLDNGRKELTEYQLKINTDAIKKEQELKQSYEQKIRDNEKTIDSINDNYNRLLADKLHNTSATSDIQVSDNSSGAKSAKCKCPRDNSAKFQRLYERQLEVSRKADIEIAKCLKAQELFKEK